MSKKVLVVEDEMWRFEYWQGKLGDRATIIGASTIEEGEELFGANPDIDVIVIDGCVPGSELNTIPLVRKFRETFKGPMIAISGNGSFREELMKVGCNREAEDKMQLHQVILETLGLERDPEIQEFQ